MKQFFFFLLIFASTVLCAHVSKGQGGIISTLAGNDSLGAGYSGDGKAATAAQLDEPQGVTADAVGNIYIADASNSVIRRVNTAGIIFTVAGNGTSGYSGDGGAAISAELNIPICVVLDAIGNIYIADTYNSVIRKVNTSGIIFTVAGNDSSGYSGDGGAATAAKLSYPAGVAFDSYGNMYIADAGNSVIRKVDTGGIISTVAGNDSSGYSGDGGAATAAKLYNPQGVAIDALNNVYIVDAYINVIRKVNTAGIISTVAGSSSLYSGYAGDGGPATAALLYIPLGVTFDNAGNMYIADDANNVIREVNTAGIISTVVGTFSVYGGYGGDGGPAKAALLNQPVSVAMDTAGNMYIADAGNNVIRKVEPCNFPVVPAITGTTGICLGSNTMLSDTATGGMWSASNGNATINKWGFVSSLSAGVDTITYTVKNSCGTTRVSAVVTIQKPVAAITGTDSVCAGAVTMLSDSSSGGTWITSDSAIARVDSSGRVTGVARGTAVITYSTSCSATATITVQNAASAIKVLHLSPNSGIITTVAGNNSLIAGYSGDGGPATTAQLNFPDGVVVDAWGNMYIADMVNNVIRKVNTAGIISTIAGNGYGAETYSGGYSGDGGPATAAELYYPSGIAIDASGNIYIADNGNSLIRKVDTSGIISTIAGNKFLGWGYSGDGGPATAAQLYYPTDVAVDASGNLYITDFENQVVRKVNTAGIITTIAGNGYGAGKYSGGYSGDGGPAIAAELNYPNGLAIDAFGNIYIADYGNNVIRKVNRAGIISTVAGNFSLAGGYSGDGGPATAAALSNPMDLVVDVSGNMYIADGSNNVIREVSSAGIISTVAGNFALGGGYSGDGGPATAATLLGPDGIAVDASGNLYIADVSNNVIRKVGGLGATYSATPDTICASSVATFSDSADGGIWSTSDSAIVVVDSLGNLKGVAAGTAKITYTVTNLCGTSSSVASVTVQKPPAAIIAGTDSVCPGAVIVLSDSSAGGTWSTSDSAIAIVNNSGDVTGVAMGSAIISYFLSKSCKAASTSIAVRKGIAPIIVIDTPYSGAIITTVAGDSSSGWGYTSDSGVATASLLANPTGIAVGASGNMYIADNGISIVWKVNTAGIMTSFAGNYYLGSGDAGDGGPATAATVNSPVGLAVDASGNVYIADAGNNVIRKVNSLGIISTVAGNYLLGNSYSGDGGPATAAGLNSPNGIAIGAYGNIYIADAGNNVIREVNTAGIITTIAGNDSLGAGYSGDGGHATSGQLNSPTNIAVDASGNLYIADYNNNVIRKVNTGGIITTVAGNGYGAGGYTGGGYSGDGGPATGAELNSPSGVATGAYGNIYITDYNNNVIRKVNSGGIISTIAGNDSLGPGYSGDGGPATAGQLYQPYGITLDGSGYIYVADARNNVIRKVGGPSFVITDSHDTICIGSEIALTDSSKGKWSTSNAAIVTVNSSGHVTGVEAGTATIAYTITTICGTFSATVAITVQRPVSVITGTDSVCAGAVISLSDSVGGGTWSTSDSTIATVNSSGHVTGVRGGMATMTYSIMNSCGATASTFPVNVKATPVLSAITGTTILCLGTTTSLSDTAKGGKWSSSTTSIATISSAGVVSGVTAGIDTIRYSASNSCGTTNKTAIVTINKIPVVSAIAGTTTLCSGTTASLSDTATGGKWSSSAPSVATISSAGAVSGVSAGIDTIKYSVSNSCGTANKTAIVTVNTTPIVAGITGKPMLCSGAMTTLADTTKGGIWSSTNKLIATVNTGGVVTGVGTGNDTITYSVSNTCGVTKKGTVVNVNTPPVVAAITGTTTLCAGGTTTLSDTTKGGVWSSTNKSIAVVSFGGKIIGVAAGIDTIKYSVTNSCSTTRKSTIVTVNATLVVTAITGTTTLCAGAKTTLNDSTKGGAWSSSNTLIATVSSAGVVSGVSAGTDTIKYSLSNSCGATKKTAIVNVITAPGVAAITGTTTLCPGAKTTLGDTTKGGTWSSSSTAIATVSTTGVLTGVATGIDTVKYSVSNSCGTTKKTAVVTVNTTPPVAAIKGVTVFKVGTTTTLTDSTKGGTWSSSSGVATVSSAGIVSGKKPGSATISYSVSNICGATTKSVVVNVTPNIHHGVDTTSSSYDARTIALDVNNTALDANIKVYPNPAQSKIFIEASEKVNARLLDMNGSILEEVKNAAEINISPYANGIYMVEVYNEQGVKVKTERIVKMGQ